MVARTLYKLDTLVLDPDGCVPNSRHPVLIWTRAIDGTDDLAGKFEARFGENGWTGAWRDGIYDYHHFHSTAHEVLGFARGRVNVQLGGRHGPVHGFGPGDVVVIPAGVAHCNVGGSNDLLVVGAYAEGRAFDICREDADQARVRRNIAALPDPAADPLDGVRGALITQWMKLPQSR